MRRTVLLLLPLLAATPLGAQGLYRPDPQAAVFGDLVASFAPDPRYTLVLDRGSGAQLFEDGDLLQVQVSVSLNSMFSGQRHAVAEAFVRLLNYSPDPLTVDWAPAVTFYGFALMPGAAYSVRTASRIRDADGFFAGAGGLHDRVTWPDPTGLYPAEEHFEFIPSSLLNHLSIRGARPDESGGVTPGVAHLYLRAEGRIVTVTPEPASLALLGTGLLGLALVARRRKA